MRVAGTRVFVALVLVAGCDGCGDAASRAGEGETTGGATAGAEGETGSEAQPAGAVDGVVIRGVPDRDRSVAIAVEARGTAPVRLAKILIVEQEQNGAFAPVDSIQSVFLRRDCRTPPEDCIELVPGAALEPPAWRGQLGDAQCDCERCVDAPAGRYRFVVTGCGGGGRVESAPFDLRGG